MCLTTYLQNRPSTHQVRLFLRVRLFSSVCASTSPSSCLGCRSFFVRQSLHHRGDLCNCTKKNCLPWWRPFCPDLTTHVLANQTLSTSKIVQAGRTSLICVEVCVIKLHRLVLRGFAVLPGQHLWRWCIWWVSTETVQIQWLDSGVTEDNKKKINKYGQEISRNHALTDPGSPADTRSWATVAV